MKTENKLLEFIYGETVLHFLMDTEGSVMVNATEMAKMFDKRVDVFMKTDHVKAFIEVLQFPQNGGNSEVNQPPNGGRLEVNQPPNGGRIIDNRGRNGIYFCRPLALKFAAWLSPEFEVWVFNTLDTIVFGNYKKHWDAHIAQERAKERMAAIKNELLVEPTQEKVIAYFEAERDSKDAESAKRRAIIDQYKLF